MRTIELLQKKNYKFERTMWLLAKLSIPITVIRDNGASPNHTSKRFLSAKLWELIKWVNDLGLMIGTKQTVEVEGVVLIYICIGDLRLRVCFGVATTVDI